MHCENNCSYKNSKHTTAKMLSQIAVDSINSKVKPKLKAVWIEAAGCSGNIISELDGSDPDILYLIENMIDLRYENSLMFSQGKDAYEDFLKALDTEFVLIVEGAVSVKDKGLYNVIATYNDIPITAADAIKLASTKAKYIIALGTYASFGGISSASPNPANCISLSSFLKLEVINLPGCPCHPDWLAGTLASIILFGKPNLDSKKRPLLFYGITIHDNCPRRILFEKKIFSQKLGENGCMFKIGCRGPVTKTDCATRNWNSHMNWPIGDNTPCIGCATEGFPDQMEPFVRD